MNNENIAREDGDGKVEGDVATMQIDRFTTLAIGRVDGRVSVDLARGDRSAHARLGIEDAATLAEHLVRGEAIDVYVARLLPSALGLALEVTEWGEEGDTRLTAFLPDDRSRLLEALRRALRPTAEEIAQAEREAAEKRAREQAEADRQKMAREQWERERPEREAREREEREERERADEQRRWRQAIDAKRAELEWRAEYGDLPMPDAEDEAQPRLPVEPSHDGSSVIVIPRFGAMRAGRPVLIYGPPESFKSWILAELGIAIALGEPTAWGGVPIHIRGKFLHLEYENPRSTTQERLDRLCRGRGVDYGDTRHILKKPAIKLTDPDAEERLTRECWGVAACGLDSLQAACDEREEEFSPVLGMLARVSDRTGTTFFPIVHAVKHPERVSGMQRLQFISGRECDSAWWVEQRSGYIHIEIDKASNVPADSVQPAKMRLVGGIGEPIHFELSGSPGAKAARPMTAAEKVRKRIVRVLVDLGALSKRGLREEVTGGNDMIGDVLTQLVQEGEVQLDPETGLYSLVEGGPSRSVEARSNCENIEKTAVRRDPGDAPSTDQRPHATSIEKKAVRRGPSRSADHRSVRARPLKGRRDDGTEGDEETPAPPPPHPRRRRRPRRAAR